MTNTAQPQQRGEQVKGSWRTAFGYKFLSSDDMDIDQSITLTITEVTSEMAYDRQSKAEKPLVSVWFEETDRALALNATNAKSISEIAGTTKCARWAGVKIHLVKTAEVFFGKVGALRVKPATQREAAA